jgi:hypothetical protein
MEIKKHCKKWTSTNGTVRTLPVTVYPEDTEEHKSVEVIRVRAIINNSSNKTEKCPNVKLYFLHNNMS